MPASIESDFYLEIPNVESLYRSGEQIRWFPICKAVGLRKILMTQGRVSLPRHQLTHQALDRAVVRLYRRTGFASERERVEHLFTLYEKMRAPLEAGVRGRRRRRR